jgi:hypothetical protein
LEFQQHGVPRLLFMAALKAHLDERQVRERPFQTFENLHQMCMSFVHVSSVDELW